MAPSEFYQASPINPEPEHELYHPNPIKPKRHRATHDEMECRAEFLITYAEVHGPVTVRQLYYQSEVRGLPGIGKDENGYKKVQHQVLQLRREKRLAYEHIADATRWMRKPTTYSSIERALINTAQFYRKSLWQDTENYVEVWCEKDALAGVIYPITSLYDVPLMVARGYSSETFCFEAVEAREGDDRDYYVYYLGDFDRSGTDAARTLKEKLTRFAGEKGVTVIFESLAVTLDQVDKLKLPTRKPKRECAADKKWPHDFACELDAIPPDYVRQLVQTSIEQHLPQEQLQTLKTAEESEREHLWWWAQTIARIDRESAARENGAAS